MATEVAFVNNVKPTITRFRSHFNTHVYGLSLRAKHIIAKQSLKLMGLPRRYAPRNDER